MLSEKRSEKYFLRFCGGGGVGVCLFEDGGWTLGEPAAPTLVPYHGKGLNSSGLLLTMVSIPS